MRKIDLLIKNGFVLRFENEDDFFQKKSIAVDSGKIISIGTTEELAEKFLPNQTISAENKIVMPGFINTHSHVPMTYFRGLADDLPLKKWLQDYIWPIENKFLSPEFVYYASLHGCAEMLKNGITTFNDMYFFGGKTAKAAEKTGIRAVIGEGVLDFSVANYHNADEIFSYIEKMSEKYKNHSLIDIAVAPHSIYSCGKENLKKAVKLSQKLGIMLHLHLSETEFEVLECVQQNGMRPVEYLNSLGFFENDVLVAHGIWIDETEQQILAKKNVSVSVNTNSNLKLANGYAPLKQYLKNGVNVSFGTDGVASNNDLNILEEMKITSLIHKTLNSDPTFLPAKEIVKMATVNGAKALKKESELGKIKVGKTADLLVIETEEIGVQPIFNPFSHLVYAITSEQIKDVIVDGKIVMKNRKLVNLDENEILEKAKFYRNKILAAKG